jgi:hypothetical protein
MMLTRDAIFAAQDRAFEDVDVPEWGGMVRIAVITGTDRDAYEASMYEMKGKEIKLNRDDMRAKLLARAIVDEDLKRIFTDADIRELGKKSSKVIDRLFTVAQRLNGMTDESVKELEKNSESGGVGSSTSPSPAN